MNRRGNRGFVDAMEGREYAAKEAKMDLDYTVETKKEFEEAVDAVTEQSGKAGFRVLATHDVAATLAEKGFSREPVTIIEVCNAKFASHVLAADIKVGLMLPCPIMVYAEGQRVFIATLRASHMAELYPDSGISEVAAEVEGVLRSIVDAAAA
ncbi:MAG: DUF302 domain-containing protein [Actinobacteria bacterium]|nr:DUF302 domain-containing protein [Actinomycetota bacterium]